MQLKVFFAGVTAVVLASCGSKSRPAFNFNQDIVGKETALVPDARKTESSVKIFFTAGQYDSIGKAGARMETLVQEKIDEIKAMPLPKAKGADKFKDAALDYFAFLKKTYSNYRKLGEAATDEERQVIIDEVKDIYNKRMEIVEEFRNAQRKYAADNGFRLETPKFGE
jgi:hypothetical protein